VGLIKAALVQFPAFVILHSSFVILCMHPDPFRLRLAALLGFLAISLGASGAHGPVHEKLKAAGELEHWATAVQYHLPHAVMLLVLTLFASSRPALIWAWRMIFAGILLFSGSLYVLAYTGMKWLGAVTPLGGLSFMIGWVLIAVSAKGK
jgi:uncharacterized membrane protein YgdD (TMEM256/DUF423 family)